MSWFIYALGGGWGHCQRAASLARAAAARGHRVEILANSPVAQSCLAPAFERDALPGIRWRILDPHWPFEVTRARVMEQVADAAPEVFIVDTFPRGLGGELADLLTDLPAARVWVHRALAPDYVECFHLADFARNFDLILVPGEDAPLAALPRALRTEPWLIADPVDLRGRELARRQLAASGDLPLVLVTSAGKPEESADSARLARRLGQELAGRCAVRLATFDQTEIEIAPAQAIAAWPLLTLLPGVDLVVGAGGYNTVHECRAAGVPLLAYARRRKYDLQHARLRPEELAPPIDRLAETIVRRLAAATDRPPPDYTNGVHAAVAAIERL